MTAGCISQIKKYLQKVRFFDKNRLEFRKLTKPAERGFFYAVHLLPVATCRLAAKYGGKLPKQQIARRIWQPRYGKTMA